MLRFYGLNSLILRALKDVVLTSKHDAELKANKNLIIAQWITSVLI